MIIQAAGALATALLKIVGALILIVPLFTFFLASLTWLNQYIRRNQQHEKSQLTTAIFTGRVSHTRFQPKRHCFAYPLFFCLVDLAEVKKLFKGRLPLMWPLNYLINFRDEDHLKNGEGKLENSELKNEDALSPRIRELVKDRTNGKFVPVKGKEEIKNCAISALELKGEPIILSSHLHP